MANTILYICIAIISAPLFAAIIAGIFGKVIGKSGAHWITIIGVAIAFILSLILGKYVFFNNIPAYNTTFFTWAISGSFQFPIGFLIDQLSVLMMMVVTFVSLLVHIYSIGYMEDDPGYQRFFSYMSLFTFAMLMLVMGNNFLTLFFGWEGVGLVSYLLIGFWFNKPSAAFGSLKAFLYNRVGDIGFLLGIAAIITYFSTLDYQQVFAQLPAVVGRTVAIWPGHPSSVINVITLLLFIGAMGKSAQVPLHAWLPESMEGPTPISAMIHAATMVTAGVFMIARLSPLFQLSPFTLSIILVLGATTALFMGILGIVQNDIKRVIAYSTLSQLGYMMVGVGVSAYSAGMFHLFTHAFFKALLFLAAGSVIIAMHHEQDMRKMGGLAKYLPITYTTFLIGGLALSAIPPFAGFYSKDVIIDLTRLSHLPGAGYAYICVLSGTFVTAFYTFRALFLTFHGKERMDAHTKAHLKEPGLLVTIPLILLAIPSIVSGFLLIHSLLFSTTPILGNSIIEATTQNGLLQLAQGFHGVLNMAFHALFTLPFWFSIAGIVVAWYFSLYNTQAAQMIRQRFTVVYQILIHKYGFDDFNEWVLIRGTRAWGEMLLDILDMKFIDDICVNGTGRVITWLSRITRHIQSGYLYHYAFVMILGVFILLGWRLI